MSAVLRALLSALIFLVALVAIMSLLNGHLGVLELVVVAGVAAGMIVLLTVARRRLA
jgi:hypothetical protein